MKKKLYFLVLLFLGSMAISNAQDQNTECMTNLSIYAEHSKVKNYDAAYTPWKMVYETCPALNLANFSIGEKILKDKIKKSSGADKDGFINQCLKLYKDRMIHFPQKTKMADMITKEVLLKYDNKMVSDDEIYSMLGKAFNEDKVNFKNPKALYLYFSSLVNLHKAGSKDLQEVFDVYDEVTEKIEVENEKLTNIVTKLLPKEEAGTLTSKEKKRLSAATNNSKSFGKVAGSVDAKLGPLADCTNLVPLYQKTFEANKTNVDWVKRAVGLMFNKECTDDPMFQKLFDAQMSLDPSADGWFYSGIIKLKNNDTSGALADFDKALGMETDPMKKSKIAYKVAVINKRKGRKSSARTYAQKAISQNSANGRAYLLIANLYATSANDCGTTTFDKRAMYWKAAEMARKAARVDPSLSSRASKSAASYNAKAPSKSDIFTAGMAGKTVSFSCWVGGSVKVPSL